MSDGISGVKNINPGYPVKPVTPSQRDRESGKRKKDPPKPDINTDTDADDDTDKPVIDEYV